MAFSIVIVCRDEEDHIERCLAAIQGLTDDIIVVDTGSKDRTLEIVRTFPVRLLEAEWMGYGATKNYANSQAVHNWILSLDADEIVDQDLFESLTKWLPVTDPVFTVKRVNHIGQRPIKFGHLKPEVKPRLFNKKHYRWDDKPVHELLSPKVKKSNMQLLGGSLLHYQAEHVEALMLKYQHYASLHEGKSGFMGTVSPYYHFLRSYVFKMGFLEGALGYALAKSNYTYSKLK